MALPGLSTIQAGRIGASLFYKKKKRMIGNIPMDLLISEEHTMQSEVAEHPIESGSSVTTHIRNKLRTGRVVGLVSNWSLGAPTGILSGGVQNRAMNTLGLLTELWYQKKPVIITTALWYYKNVVITDISVKRDGESGDAQTYEISFKEINVVDLKRVETEASTDVGFINGSSSDNQKQASKKKDKGGTSGSSGKIGPTPGGGAASGSQSSTMLSPKSTPSIMATQDNMTTASGVPLEEGFVNIDHQTHYQIPVGGVIP